VPKFADADDVVADSIDRAVGTVIFRP
jgi:hypothetical protein